MVGFFGKGVGVRAVVCEQWGGPEMLVVRDLPGLEAGTGEVVLKVHAAGVNFPDVLIIQKKYQVQPELPFTPGAEVSGEVLQVGAGVEGLVVGDQVVALCGTGGFAEQVVVAAGLCMKIPKTLDPRLAASFVLAYGTSWHALYDRGALQAGETLLVLGAAGGVGLAAIQIAKLIGARVVAAASSEQKCAVCREHGADETIDYTAEDLRAGIKRTCGKGPNVIYDPVGGAYTEAAFRSIGWRGRHLVVGFAAGEIPAVPLNLALLKSASFVGVFWGEYTKREPARWGKDFAEMVACLEDGRLRPLVSRTYGLDETAEALKDMAERRVVGKVVIVP